MESLSNGGERQDKPDANNHRLEHHPPTPDPMLKAKSSIVCHVLGYFLETRPGPCSIFDIELGGAVLKAKHLVSIKLLFSQSPVRLDELPTHNKVKLLSRETVKRNTNSKIG